MMTHTQKHKQLQCYALINLHLYYTAQMTVTDADELDNLQSVLFLEHSVFLCGNFEASNSILPTLGCVLTTNLSMPMDDDRYRH